MLGGEDVLAVMPTGSGKSLCFQLPAHGARGPDAGRLAADRADARPGRAAPRARRRGGEPQFVFRRRASAAAIAEGLRDRSLRLLYIAPERLLRDDVLDKLRGASIDLSRDRRGPLRLAMGTRFPSRISAAARGRRGAWRRPDDRRDGDRRRADPRRDRRAGCSSRTPQVFVRSFDRPNLFLAMRPKTNATRQLVERLDAHAGESGIIYCASRRRTEELAEEFAALGRRALPYHAGLDHSVRAANQDAFLREDGVVDLRDHRLRHGHRQARRALRLSRRHAVLDRGLLPGDRPRRPRRAAGRRLHALRRRRHRAAPPADRSRAARPTSASASRWRSSTTSSRCARRARCRRQTLLGMFGEEIGRLRPLRRLQGRGAPDRRPDRGAKGAVGGVAHLGAVLLRPSRQHPRRQDDRGGRAARARPAQDLRRRRGPDARPTGAACCGNCSRRG